MQTRNGTLIVSQFRLTSCTEINTVISSNPELVSNTSDARKWLETKGWILSGKNYDHSKLVKILLTVSLSPKLPTEAINTIQAVAFVLEDNITDMISSALAATVRGRSTSSDVSSDISPSPLYIPPHRRQPKTECTRGSDTGVR